MMNVVCEQNFTYLLGLGAEAAKIERLEISSVTLLCCLCLLLMKGN